MKMGTESLGEQLGVAGTDELYQVPVQRTHGVTSSGFHVTYFSFPFSFFFLLSFLSFTVPSLLPFFIAQDRTQGLKWSTTENLRK